MKSLDNFDFVLENLRFDVYEPNVMSFAGWFRNDNPDGRRIEVFVDEQKVPVTITTRRGIEVRQRYLMRNANVTEEMRGRFSLPVAASEIRELRIYSVLEENRSVSLRVTGEYLCRLSQKVQCNVELLNLEEGTLRIAGWVADKDPVAFEVYAGGRKLDCTISYNPRRDVSFVYDELDESVQPGFVITAKLERWRTITLVVKTASGETKERYPRPVVQKDFTPLQKVFRWICAYGVKVTAQRVIAEFTGKPFKVGEASKVEYSMWRKKYEPTTEEIEAERGVRLDYEPLFSIVIPLYQTRIAYLKELLDSILGQTYTNWELCLADGSGKDSVLLSVIREYMERDKRICYTLLEDNKGISENTNAAIRMATGDFIVLADHDDILPLNALMECAKALNQDRTVDVIYSDEDKIDMDGKKYFDPHFKSDFNIDLLCSMNYICHLFVVKRSIVEQVGMLKREYDGAQDLDFILRCCEVAKHICHIPKILYHWRCHLDSTASNPESKMYAFEAGRKAIEAHYKRLGIPAHVEHGQFYGMYKTVYEWEDKPLVSIIIPNKDHIEDLRKCMDSIDELSTYRNYEFVIVENNSTEEETFAYYKSIEERENVQVLYYEGEFNFSRINNFGAKHARGDYFLLLNNDTQIINPDCLWEMLGYCMRKDVGIVGARLYYPDDTIQHAGVVLGFGGMAGHTFIGCSRYDNGYFSRIICAQDLSAVTAACMMVKRSVFEEVEGLSEEYRVAFNDVDFCMKVREKGYLIVYNPAVELYHFESKSRGLEDTPEKVARFNSEVDRFLIRWDKELKAGDPYYNVNLSLNRSDFGLRE